MMSPAAGTSMAERDTPRPYSRAGRTYARPSRSRVTSSSRAASASRSGRQHSSERVEDLDLSRDRRSIATSTEGDIEDLPPLPPLEDPSESLSSLDSLANQLNLDDMMTSMASRLEPRPLPAPITNRNQTRREVRRGIRSRVLQGI